MAEGIEVVVAALAQDNGRLVEEVADLTYHTLVLLAARGLTIEDVEAELESRHRKWAREKPRRASTSIRGSLPVTVLLQVANYYFLRHCVRQV